MGLTVWLKGIRLPLYWASGAPVLLTLALALRTGLLLRPYLWIWGTVALFVFEIGVNLVAEMADKNEGVFVTQRETWVPTGPYLIDSTGIAAEKLARYAALAFAVAGIAGLYLAALTGFAVIMLIGLAGFILMVVYALPPLMLGVRGIGEPVPFIAFGPLPGLALYFLLSGRLSEMAVLATLPAAFWITAVRFVHHLPDRSMKRGTKFVRIHQWRTDHATFLLSVFLLSAFLSIFAIYPLAGILTLLPAAVSLPLTYSALRSTQAAAGNAVEISRRTKYYLLLQFAGSVAMSIALVLG